MAVVLAGRPCLMLASAAALCLAQQVTGDLDVACILCHIEAIGCSLQMAHKSCVRLYRQLYAKDCQQCINALLIRVDTRMLLRICVSHLRYCASHAAVGAMILSRCS